MPRTPLLLLLSVLFITTIRAQLAWQPGELLVRMAKDGRPEAVQQELLRQLPAGRVLKSMQPLGRDARYHKLVIQGTGMADSALEDLVARIPGVEATSLNYLVQHRAQPNDPQYGSQWHLADMNVETVWNTSTGGAMANGKRIAVGIIDSGVQGSHPDLADNMVFDASASFDHGTEVAGVVGAVGNNGVGVSGVNWDVDLVSPATVNDLGDAFSQFQLCLNERELFNQTNGVQGRLIVSLTISWGVPGADCGFGEPMFDNLGAAGILVVTSGPNDGTDIDVVPDYPATCPNDNNIVVTSYGQLNEVPFAVGDNTVHLLAPGLDILTTEIGGGYATADGNSFAIPAVAGAVALLYSNDCFTFAQATVSDPQGTAMLVKQAILTSVTPFPGGNAITITGGKLNVHAAYQALASQCLPCTEVVVALNTPAGNDAQYTLANGFGTVVSQGSGASIGFCAADGCYSATLEDSGSQPLNGTFAATLDGIAFASGNILNGELEFELGTVVLGCTNPAALNYNPNATCNDGSCCTEGFVQVAILTDALGLSGSVDVTVTLGGTVIHDGPLPIADAPGYGVAGALLTFCEAPGCLSVVVGESNVALAATSLVSILSGQDLFQNSFGTGEGYFGPVGNLVELCDGLDNDCDGVADEDFTWYADADSDGWGAPASEQVFCVPPGGGFVQLAGDCNDSDPNMNPEMLDPCGTADGIDNNCDGTADEGDLLTWYPDLDTDGFGDTDLPLLACTAPANHVLADSDCDDTNSDVFPGATETCDGLDNDCDGTIDEDFLWYTDADDDGFGNDTTATPSCVPVSGAVQVGGDCDDSDATKQQAVILTVLAAEDSEVGTAHYIATQGSSVIEGDIVLTFDQVSFGEAQICLGQGCFSITIVEVDVALSQDSYIQTEQGLGPQQFLTFDGFFGSAGTPDVELCDGLDNNCDGVVDDGFLWYTDADGDGVGVTSTEQFSCTPLAGAVQVGGDCNDADTNLTTVGAPCDDGDPGTVGDVVRPQCICLGFPQGSCPEGEIEDCNGNCAPTEWIGDGICDDGAFEHNGIPIFFNCPSFFNDGGDCGGICPNEVCNGQDDDCDGEVDEGLTQLFADADGDGAGDPAQPVGCAGVGVANANDCDDTDPTINPAAMDVCDGVDNNCNGQVDEGILWYVDADGDGYGTIPLGTQCSQPANSASISGDCDDTDPVVFTAFTLLVLTDDPADVGTAHYLIQQGSTVIEGDLALPVETEGIGELPVCVGDGCYTITITQNDVPLYLESYLIFPSAPQDLIPFATADGYQSSSSVEICDGADNDCDGLVDEGFATALSCPADTVVTAPAFACAVSVDYPDPITEGCAAVSITRLSGPPSGGLFTVGTTPVVFGMQLADAPGPVVLNEDFSDNSGGWALDTEWAIGQATASACAATCTGNDPSLDNTPTADNGVAGMNMGGCVATSLHGFRYLTSPTVDASGGDSLTLRFHRHLHGDYAPFMQHVVQVFDGATWVTIWSHVPQVCINDVAWTLQEFDVTAYKNTTFAVRFGQSVSQGGAFSSGGWNVDDVLLFNELPYADTCSFTVTVVPSATDASLPCGSPITFTTDEGSCATNSVQLEFPGTFFSCALDTLFHDAPASLPIGTTSFHWIAVYQDLSTDTCTQSVTVVDNEAPLITCAPTMSLVADAQSCVATNVALIAPGATDNCTVQSILNDHPSTTYPAGTTIVTWTATDAAGNAATCIQMVNVAGNSGEPPVPSCSPDTVLTLDTQLCGAQYTYDQPTLLSNCITIPLPLIGGPASGSTFAPGTTQVSFAYTGELLNEDFSDNSNGWSLDAEWMIGTANSSFCAAACSGNDPGTDHTPTTDQGVAGMNIGGCVSTSLHAFRYLTSTSVDASYAGALTVEFWRHLHTDYSPFMQHRVQVFDGLAWVTIWEHVPQTCINDADWTLQSFDVTAYKNPLFRVRFGKAVAAGGAFTSGGWSVDDVRIFDPASGPPAACSFLVSVEGLPYWYADLDGDGYGANTDSTAACAPPVGYVGNTLDCNDACSVCNPDMLEACDGFDNDCDGLVDEGCSVAINARVFLEGPYSTATGQMNDGMRALGLVPTVEPYSGLGYTHAGGGGGETTTPAVLANTGTDAIVDWVVLELRDENSPSTVVASRSALVQRDGDVVDVDGTSPVSIAVASGNYHVAMRHRNHLGCMSAGPVVLSPTVASVDFTLTATATYGANSRKAITGTFPAQALWAGDVTFNGQVKYTGSGNDRDPVLTTVGSTTPNNTVSIYSTRDVNMNGQVKYTGSANDRDPILVNVGSTTPNNVRVQQLP